jgi:hypothetical protein
MRPTARALVLALALAVLLTGCHPPTLTKVRSWPGATPVFASEEEALAAAEEAYGEYQDVVDRALATYEIEELSRVAQGEALEAAIQSVRDFEAQGHRFVGASSVDSVALISVGGLLTGDRIEPAEIHACLDISRTDVLGPSGTSVVTDARPARYPVRVLLQSARATSRLLVLSEEVWDGENFCA